MRLSRFTSIKYGEISALYAVLVIIVWVGQIAFGGAEWFYLYLAFSLVGFVLVTWKNKLPFVLWFWLVVFGVLVPSVALVGQLWFFEPNALARLLPLVFGLFYSYLLARSEYGGTIFLVGSWVFLGLYWTLNSGVIDIWGVSLARQVGLGVNSVGFFVVLSLACLVMQRWKNNGPAPYVVLFVALITVLLGDYFARGNFLSVSLLLAMTFLFFSEAFYIRRLLVLLSVFVFVVFLLVSGSTFFYRGFDLGVRLDIWLAYLNYLDWVRLIFGGADIQSVEFLGQWGGNLHNAYLQFHSRYGVGVIILVAFLGFMVYAKLASKEFLGAFVLLVVMFRSLTDVVVLGSYLDFFFFYVAWAGSAKNGLKRLV